MVTHPKAGKQALGEQTVRPIPLEDVELVEKVKAGQTEAYGQLVEKYQDRVFNACWRICGHLEDARDLTQDAFLKAFENLSSFRQQSGFYTWIFRVAVNLALSHRRRESKRRTFSLDGGREASGTQAEGLVPPANPGGAGDPSASASEADMHRRVVEALHALDEDHRAVIVLRDIEGMNYQEIGEILDLPPGTVRSRLHRGRMALREAVQPGISRSE